MIDLVIFLNYGYRYLHRNRNHTQMSDFFPSGAFPTMNTVQGGWVKITHKNTTVILYYGKHCTEGWKSGDNPANIYGTTCSFDQLIKVGHNGDLQLIKADIAMHIIARLFNEEREIRDCECSCSNNKTANVINLHNIYYETTYTIVVMRTNQRQPDSSVIDQIYIDNRGWFSLWDQAELESNTWSSGAIGQIMAKFTHSELQWPITRKFKLFSIIDAEDSVNVTWQAIMNKIHKRTSPLSFELLFGITPADRDIVPEKTPVAASKPEPVFQPIPEVRADTVKQEPAFQPCDVTHADTFENEVVKRFQRIKDDSILYMHMLRGMTIPDSIKTTIYTIYYLIVKDPQQWDLTQGRMKVTMMSADLLTLQKYIIGCGNLTSHVDASIIALIYTALRSRSEVRKKFDKAFCDDGNKVRLQTTVEVLSSLESIVVPRLTVDKLLEHIDRYNRVSEHIDTVMSYRSIFSNAPLKHPFVGDSPELCKAADELTSDILKLQITLDRIDDITSNRTQMIDRIRSRFPRDYDFKRHDDEFIRVMFNALK